MSLDKTGHIKLRDFSLAKVSEKIFSTKKKLTIISQILIKKIIFV